jgi:hypothetical protein
VVPSSAAAAANISNYQKRNAAAVVYYIKATPATTAKLHQTANNALKWQDHAAVGAFDKEAILLFPSVDKVDVENSGLSDCKGKHATETSRRPVQQLQSNQNDHIIDMISLNVEGYDWALKPVDKQGRCMELEYK